MKVPMAQLSPFINSLGGKEVPVFIHTDIEMVYLSLTVSKESAA